MFRGQFEHAMDAKGRISLPSRFRDALAASGEPRVIVTQALGMHCLDVFSIKSWEALEERVLALPRFDPKVLDFKRVYVSPAVECELDAQSRILIPPNLRAHAKLDKQVVWAGMIEKAELWAAELWTDVYTTAQSDMSALRSLGEQLKL
jgi:MraZ protein